MNLIEKVLATNFGGVTVGETSLADSQTVGGLMTLIIGWVSAIVGALAFIYLVYSGILYITAGGNADQAKKAQTGILNAIIGIVIVILAYTIVSVVAGTFKKAT